MSPLLTTKNLILWLGATAAFTAAYWFNKPADSEVAIVQPVSRNTTVLDATRSAAFPLMPSQSVLRPPARGAITSGNEKAVFSQHSWMPPPAPAPPRAPPPPPAKPVPPPLPFSFVGLLDEPGVARRVFLSREDRLIIVKTNDVVEGQYRVDQITENSVDLTYLPLNQKQTISIQQAGL